MRNVVSLLAGGCFVLLVAATPVAAQEKHAAIGPDKCAKVCHKIQFQSWAKTKHATTTDKDKRAECETCHGNGADYAKLQIMKDPAKAKAAGLIAKPDKAGCARCHKPGEIKDDMLAKVHDHKPKA
jgi:hypothetical protein